MIIVIIAAAAVIMTKKGDSSSWYSFLTYRFAATKMIEGALQAVGAILVYAVVIWAVIAGFVGDDVRTAISLKTGGVVTPISPSPLGGGDPSAVAGAGSWVGS